MLRPTIQDYVEAEKIIIGNSESYRYLFDSGYLERLDEEKRHPLVEAALIDILLKHDNEGGRIQLSSFPSIREMSLRSRLNHIRKHTDPHFFREEKERRRKTAQRMAELMGVDSGNDGSDYGFTHQSKPDSLLWLGAAYREFSKYIKKNSIASIDWRHDFKGGYYQLLQNLNLLNEKDNSSFRRKDYYDWSAYFTFVCSGYDDFYTGDTFSQDKLEIIVPLARETQRDELAFEMRLKMIEENVSKEDLESYDSDCFLCLEEYEKRVIHMKEEVSEIELELADIASRKLENLDLRRDQDFENLESIQLWVDRNFWEMVKKITASSKGITLPKSDHVLELR